MNAILGYAQLLQRDRALRGGQRDAVETIMNSGRHLIELIDDVLDISKIEAGRAEMRMADVDLRAMAVGIAGMFRHQCEQKGISLKVECQAELPARVRADERKLRQVLINLLGNAVKFTREGSVRTANLNDRRGIAQWRRPRPTRLPIRSQSTPAKAFRSRPNRRYFEPFQQGSAGRKWGGTGLGLAIARRLVELMGGQLELDSTPGSGSRFYFSLALAPGVGEAAEPRRREVLALSPGQSVRAMVVDDVLENRQVLARLLGAGRMRSERRRQRRRGVAPVGAARAAHHFPRRADARHRRDGVGAADSPALGIEDVRWLPLRRRHSRTSRKGILPPVLRTWSRKPVRCERLYECLSDLLGVKFDYVAEAMHDRLGDRFTQWRSFARIVARPPWSRGRTYTA